MLQWVPGTALRPLLDALEPDEREALLEVCPGGLRDAYPMRPDGATLFPFPRLFIVLFIVAG